MADLTIENLTEALQAAVTERPPSEPDFLKETNNFKRKPPTYDVGIIAFAQFRLDFDLAVEQSGFRMPIAGKTADVARRRDKCTYSDNDKAPVNTGIENEEDVTSGDPCTEEDSVNTVESHEFDFDNWRDDFIGL